MYFPDWAFFVLFFVALFVLIGLAELVRRLMHWSTEATRKSVHIITGLLVATTPFVLESMWPMLVLACIFIALNFMAIKLGTFKAMHSTERATYGTVFFPLAFFILVVLLWHSNPLILVTTVLILAVPDAIAAIVGENVKKAREYFLGAEKKSIQGSAAMLAATVIVTFICISIFGYLHPQEISVLLALWVALSVGVFATVCEAISISGSDNLTVPLGSAFVMHYMLHHPVADAAVFTLGMFLALVVAFVSYRARFLDAGGAAATFLLGTVVFGVGRWTFSAPILTFFLLSSLLSKLGRKRKKRVIGIFEKSGCRDLWQVLANGGVAGVILLLWNYFPDNFWYVLFLGSLASVTADTWGTEIGILSNYIPRSIVNFNKVPIGTSGGITLLGSAGAFMGSLVLVSVGWIFSPNSSPRTIGANEFVIVLFAGLFASLVDSVLGATVQAQYRCPSCGKITEKIRHCDDEPTQLQRGYRWINNDVVNAFCALSGVLFVWVGVYLLAK